MRRTVRENINPAFSLHDMNVVAFEVGDNNITECIVEIYHEGDMVFVAEE